DWRFAARGSAALLPRLSLPRLAGWDTGVCGSIHCREWIERARCTRSLASGKSHLIASIPSRDLLFWSWSSPEFFSLNDSFPLASKSAMLPDSEEVPLRIAVIGAGGVGGYYGGALARCGHEVSLLARGEHLAALRSRGLEVREPEGPFTVTARASERPEDLLPADLAIVAVKSYSVVEVS